MNIRGTADVTTPAGPKARRDGGPFLDVEVPWCQAPDGLRGAEADAGPPGWRIAVDGGSVQATLARSPAAAGTLAALDDPSACRATTLRAQVLGTQLALASFTDAGGLDAYLAWDCEATAAPHGYSVSTDSTGGVWATLTGTVSPGCAAPTSAVFGPLPTAPLMLQRAATPTTNASLAATTDVVVPGIGNFTWPSAAVAALCAPYIASAVANYNYTAPLTSLEAAVQNNTQKALFGALGPVGGSIVLVTVGAVVTSFVGGLAAYVARRQQKFGFGGPGVAAPAGIQADVGQDPQAIDLSTFVAAQLKTADALATPLKFPSGYQNLGSTDTLALAPTLGYADGGLASPATAPPTPGPSSAYGGFAWGTNSTSSQPAAAASPATSSTGSGATTVAAGRAVAPTVSSSSAPSDDPAALGRAPGAATTRGAARPGASVPARSASNAGLTPGSSSSATSQSTAGSSATPGSGYAATARTALRGGPRPQNPPTLSESLVPARTPSATTNAPTRVAPSPSGRTLTSQAGAPGPSAPTPTASTAAPNDLLSHYYR